MYLVYLQLQYSLFKAINLWLQYASYPVSSAVSSIYSYSYFTSVNVSWNWPLEGTRTFFWTKIRLIIEERVWDKSAKVRGPTQGVPRSRQANLRWLTRNQRRPVANFINILRPSVDTAVDPFLCRRAIYMLQIRVVSLWLQIDLIMYGCSYILYISWNFIVS